MSVQGNLSATISQYQNEKASCEAQIATLNTELAVSQSHLNQLKEKSIATFGTDDINQLNGIYTNLSTEYTALEKELTELNNLS